MSEKNFWKYIKKGMAPYWEVCRIESPYTSGGIPDVIFSMKGVRGFMELKYMKSFPKKENTPIRIRNLHNKQIEFLARHYNSAGKCYVFLQIENEYLLFSTFHIGFLKTGEPKQILIGMALKHWKNKINFLELSKILKGENYE
jgi:hypothetical protein